jgi:hypothetical protein
VPLLLLLQTYLKDWHPMPRKPLWLRHYNLSVVPPRCGDINIEPLFPFDTDDRFIFDYAQCTIEEFSSYVLEEGECGKAGPDGNPRALSYTKRSNPASLGTPWLGPGGGEDGGPGDPGYPGTGGSFQTLCVEECSCSTSGHTIQDPGACPLGGCPPCTDENCGQGRCLVCSPSFNKNLASNNTLVRLWCDPADPACKNNEPTRLPKNVRVLADFAPGSHHRFAWTDHNSKPPTSNLTIVDPVIPAAARVNFATTTSGSGCYVCAVEDVGGKLRAQPGYTTFTRVVAGGSSKLEWTEHKDKGYTCSAKEFKGEIGARQWNQVSYRANTCRFLIHVHYCRY